MSVFKRILNWIYLVIKNIFIIIYKGLKTLVIFIYKGFVIVFKFIFNLIFNIFKYLFYSIKCLFAEICLLIKKFFYGIYYSIKYLIKFIILIGKYMFKAIAEISKIFYKIIKYIFNIIFIILKFLYKYLKYVFIEIYILLESFALSFFVIFKYVFYIIPKFILSAFSSFIYFIYNKIKNFLKETKEFIKSLPKRIANYFIKKWNNLALVKYYKNKRDRELEILFIDKDSEDAVRSEIKKTYKYLARNKDGKLIKGYFSALSKLDVHSYLLDEGYEVYEIKTSSWINFIHGESRTLRVKMKTKDLIFWLAQISTYIKSGIPLTDSIKILAQQDKRKKYKKVYDSIIYELTMGESFSKALEKQGFVFPGLLINMIAAAELIGDIESTLDEMVTYYTEIEDTRKSIISAMTYPAIIFVFAIGVISFILIYIIPQFVDVYSQVGVELNPVTVFVLNLSDFIKRYYFFMIIGFIGLIVSHRLLFRYLKAYKTTVQYINMHIPVVGKIIIYNEINLFAKTFSALNKNNVLLDKSIDILSKITNNEIYKMIMFDTIANLLRGDKMSVSFKDNWAVPDIAYYMITTGESTGELSAMLDKVSDFYQKQQKGMINALKSFIEPIMILFLAVIVGGVILSVIVPLFSLYSAIQ